MIVACPKCGCEMGVGHVWPDGCIESLQIAIANEHRRRLDVEKRTDALEEMLYAVRRWLDSDAERQHVTGDMLRAKVHATLLGSPTSFSDAEKGK